MNRNDITEERLSELLKEARLTWEDVEKMELLPSQKRILELCKDHSIGGSWEELRTQIGSPIIQQDIKVLIEKKLVGFLPLNGKFEVYSRVRKEPTMRTYYTTHSWPFSWRDAVRIASERIPSLLLLAINGIAFDDLTAEEINRFEVGEYDRDEKATYLFQVKSSTGGSDEEITFIIDTLEDEIRSIVDPTPLDEDPAYEPDVDPKELYQEGIPLSNEESQ